MDALSRLKYRIVDERSVELGVSSASRHRASKSCLESSSSSSSSHHHHHGLILDYRLPALLMDALSRLIYRIVDETSVELGVNSASPHRLSKSCPSIISD
jgi:hypothetical protein